MAEGAARHICRARLPNTVARPRAAYFTPEIFPTEPRFGSRTCSDLGCFPQKLIDRRSKCTLAC